MALRRQHLQMEGQIRRDGRLRGQAAEDAGEREQAAEVWGVRSAGSVPTIGEKDKWPSHAVVVRCFGEPVYGEGSAKGYLALMRVEVAVMLAAVLPADAVAHPRR